jgi:hypothetical protein
MEIYINFNKIEATASNEIVINRCIKTVVSLTQYIIYYIWKTPLPKSLLFSFNRLSNSI